MGKVNKQEILKQVKDDVNYCHCEWCDHCEKGRAPTRQSIFGFGIMKEKMDCFARPMSGLAMTMLLLMGFEAKAQCVMNQDCASLGYTKTASECSGQNGLKCPFGDKWSCPSCETTVFKHTCTGSSYAGGVGKACGGKYATCNCASGYVWQSDYCARKSSYTFSCCSEYCDYNSECLQSGRADCWDYDFDDCTEDGGYWKLIDCTNGWRGEIWASIGNFVCDMN